MFRSISASCKLAGLVTSASFFMLKSCKDDTSELGQNLVGYPIVAKSECKSSDCMKSPVGSGVSIKGKVVLITGATSGIGEACAHRFAEEGSKLILIGRRESRLDSIKTHLTAKYHGLQVLTVPLDVTDLKRVAALPETLPSDFKDVEILVNNAGLALGLSGAQAISIEDANTMLDTNVKGLIAFTRAFLPGMLERGRGHVINMGSIAGHYSYPNGSTYNASKFAVKGFTDAARHDLVGTPIRVTLISPGMVETEFSKVRFKGDDRLASRVYQDIVPLVGIDVADNVVYAATRPEHVQIADIISYPTNQSAPNIIAKKGPNFGRIV